MLRYSDRFPQDERFPECFGRDAYFDPKTTECQRCDFFNRCSSATRGRKGVSIPVRGVDDKERMPSKGLQGRTHAGIVQEGETAFQRFVKDVVTGAARGASYESYEFWTYFRL
jgi:hypothetical protein